MMDIEHLHTLQVGQEVAEVLLTPTWMQQKQDLWVATCHIPWLWIIDHPGPPWRSTGKEKSEAMDGGAVNKTGGLKRWEKLER